MPALEAGDWIVRNDPNVGGLQVELLWTDPLQAHYGIERRRYHIAGRLRLLTSPSSFLPLSFS